MGSQGKEKSASVKQGNKPWLSRCWVFVLGIKPKPMALPLSYILNRPVEVLKQQASVLICILPGGTLLLNEWSSRNLAKQKPKFLLEHRRVVSDCILIIVLWLFGVWYMHVCLYVHPGGHRSTMDILLQFFFRWRLLLNTELDILAKLRSPVSCLSPPHLELVTHLTFFPHEFWVSQLRTSCLQNNYFIHWTISQVPI